MSDFQRYVYTVGATIVDKMEDLYYVQILSRQNEQTSILDRHVSVKFENFETDCRTNPESASAFGLRDQCDAQHCVKLFCRQI